MIKKSISPTQFYPKYTHANACTEESITIHTDFQFHWFALCDSRSVWECVRYVFNEKCRLRLFLFPFLFGTHCAQKVSSKLTNKTQIQEKNKKRTHIHTHGNHMCSSYNELLCAPCALSGWKRDNTML